MSLILSGHQNFSKSFETVDFTYKQDGVSLLEQSGQNINFKFVKV